MNKCYIINKYHNNDQMVTKLLVIMQNWNVLSRWKLFSKNIQNILSTLTEFENLRILSLLLFINQIHTYVYLFPFIPTVYVRFKQT